MTSAPTGISFAGVTFVKANTVLIYQERIFGLFKIALVTMMTMLLGTTIALPPKKIFEVTSSPIKGLNSALMITTTDTPVVSRKEIIPIKFSPVAFSSFIFCLLN